MQRSDSCLFLAMGTRESDDDTHTSSGGFAVGDEHVVRTSLESIGIRCNDECIEKLCHDVLCLDEAGRRSREDHGQLLLLKVSDVIKVLEMMTDDGTCTRLVEGCICSNSINEKKVDMEMTVSIKNDMRKAASLENGAIKTKSQPRSGSMSTQR